MRADDWLTVAIAGFSTAGLATITAVALFFALHIRAVQGELSGRTAAREMKAMRENNQRLAERKNRYEREYADDRREAEETEPMQERGASGQKTEGTTLLGGGGGRRREGTSLLRGGTARRTEGTVLLAEPTGRQEGGRALPQEEAPRRAEGTVLLSGARGTEILSRGGECPKRPEFAITRRMIEIHTEERIRGS